MNSSSSTAVTAESARRTPPLWQRLLPWLVTAVCFAYLYRRLEGAAAAQGSSLIPYLAGIFADVPWLRWLGLMIPYCLFFFVLDTFIVWRVVNWFNTKISYGELIPIRGASYILSIINEQISKGAMAVYLNRRYGVPGWELGSSMLFMMVCEYYELLLWATVGVLIEWNSFPPIFHLIPWIAVGSAVFLTLWHLFFTGRLLPQNGLRNRQIFRAFRIAKFWYYGWVIMVRTPMLLSAVVIYTLALRLFGVDVAFRQMLGYLPVILFGATTPGPMRSVAILLWVVLFPDKPGEITAFGFVQHNFFIFFNAGLGAIFLRRATQALEAPAGHA